MKVTNSVVLYGLVFSYQHVQPGLTEQSEVIPEFITTFTTQITFPE
jgi:hypothetical protein